jgi:hypothetical protein
MKFITLLVLILSISIVVSKVFKYRSKFSKLTSRMRKYRTGLHLRHRLHEKNVVVTAESSSSSSSSSSVTHPTPGRYPNTDDDALTNTGLNTFIAPYAWK